MNILKKFKSFHVVMCTKKLKSNERNDYLAKMSRKVSLRGKHSSRNLNNIKETLLRKVGVRTFQRI